MPRKSKCEKCIYCVQKIPIFEQVICSHETIKEDILDVGKKIHTPSHCAMYTTKKDQKKEMKIVNTMIKLCEKFGVWLIDKYPELFADISSGRFDLFTDKMNQEYIDWCRGNKNE